jgi:hypothetical protein
MNFANCEFYGGIAAMSGSKERKEIYPTAGKITQKIYPQLTIFGANFYGASFGHNFTFIGVNFAPRKQKIPNDSVSFDEAKFECFSIQFSKSEFCNLTLVNSKISCDWLIFQELLIHQELDISCDIDADEDLKKIKALYSGSFKEVMFGHESTYQKIRTRGQDIGGRLICRNRIFQSDVSFFACEFYQAPDFLNTRFDGNVDFQWSKFFDPSSFKYCYYSNYRTIKFEMARKNLYREEKLFHRYEEKCANNQKAFEYESWQGIPIKKIKNFLKNPKIYFQKKSKLAVQPAKKLEKKSAEKFETFLSHQSLSEKIFSSLFELICRRGTSFNRIIWVFFLFNIFVFPLCYLVCLTCYGPLFNDLSEFFLEPIKKSAFYATHPFYLEPKGSAFCATNPYLKPDQVAFCALHPFYLASKFRFLEIFISTIQSIFNVTIYVIFGFILRKRFKMSD